MFDLHYHMLYGVDDGPKNIEESVAMAEASIAEGTTHVVCTPHLNHKYAFNLEASRDALARIQERVEGRLTLALGCEFHLAFEHMELLKENPDALRHQQLALHPGRAFVWTPPAPGRLVR